MSEIDQGRASRSGLERMLARKRRTVWWEPDSD